MCSSRIESTISPVILKGRPMQRRNIDLPWRYTMRVNGSSHHQDGMPPHFAQLQTPHHLRDLIRRRCFLDLLGHLSYEGLPFLSTNRAFQPLARWCERMRYSH